MSEITRLDLLAGQLDMPALTPELQAPQRTFGINLSFWKLCLEARKIRNEERKEKKIIQSQCKCFIPQFPEILEEGYCATCGGRVGKEEIKRIKDNLGKGKNESNKQ